MIGSLVFLGAVLAIYAYVLRTIFSKRLAPAAAPVRGLRYWWDRLVHFTE